MPVKLGGVSGGRESTAVECRVFCGVSKPWWLSDSRFVRIVSKPVLSPARGRGRVEGDPAVEARPGPK